MIHAMSLTDFGGECFGGECVELGGRFVAVQKNTISESLQLTCWLKMNPTQSFLEKSCCDLAFVWH